MTPVSMTVSPDTPNRFVFANEAGGFAETGTETCFAFDKWIMLLADSEFQPDMTAEYFTDCYDS